MKTRSSGKLFLDFVCLAAFVVFVHMVGDVSWRFAIGTACGLWLIWSLQQEVESLRTLFAISDEQLVIVSQQVTDLQCEIIDLRSELEQVRNSSYFS